MGKRRTLTYKLKDGQSVTCREVADEIGISESAARNRLAKSDDPKKIFEPYSESNGGIKQSKSKQKPKKVLPYEDKLWRLVMKTLGSKK